MRLDEGPRGRVESLTEDHTGRWLITTGGSTHLWDLDVMTYVRSPRQDDPIRGLDWDGQQVLIWKVITWPVVQHRFELLFANPELDAPTGGVGIKVRRSSPIRSIEYLGHGRVGDHGE